MNFDFYINGVQIEEPIGWDEFEEELVRDDVKRHIYFNYPLQLTFFGVGYELIYNQYKEDFNSKVVFSVFEDGQHIINADIKITNCRRNLTEFTYQCDIDDASYQSRVFDSLKSEIYPSSRLTKSNQQMDGANNLELTVYDPTTGVDLPNKRVAFDVFDCMKALIDFVSDGTINFVSGWYESLENWEKLCIITGSSLRTHVSNTEPRISIDSLFKELWKKYNLYLIVENPLINPTIRLEREDYLFENDDAVVVDDIRQLYQMFDLDKLYNSIRVGSVNYKLSFSSEWLFPYFQFFGFSEESYSISGVVGVDNELDLVSQYIIDTNEIQSILEGSQSRDDRIVLIQYNNETNTATRGTYWELDDGYLYNEQLLNAYVLERFKYYGDLVSSSGLLLSDFQASRVGSDDQSQNIRSDNGSPAFTDYWLYNAYPYNDDVTPPNFDEDDNYDPVNYEYEAPSTGVFRLRASLSLTVLDKEQILPTPGQSLPWPYNDLIYNPNFRQAVDMRFQVNDAAFFDTEEIRVVSTSPNGAAGDQIWPRPTVNGGVINTATNTIGYTNTFIIERSLSLVQGDKVKVYASVKVPRISAPVVVPPQPGEWRYDLRIKGGIYLTVTTPGTGGQYEPADPNSVQVGMYQHEEKFISSHDWARIRNQPMSRMLLNTGNNDPRATYPKRISRVLKTGMSTIETTFNRLQPHI